MKWQEPATTPSFLLDEMGVSFRCFARVVLKPQSSQWISRITDLSHCILPLQSLLNADASYHPFSYLSSSQKKFPILAVFRPSSSISSSTVSHQALSHTQWFLSRLPVTSRQPDHKKIPWSFPDSTYLLYLTQLTSLSLESVLHLASKKAQSPVFFPVSGSPSQNLFLDMSILTYNI
jgi:hypothetical protein